MSRNQLIFLTFLLLCRPAAAAPPAVYFTPGGYLLEGIPQKIVLLDDAEATPPSRIGSVEQVGNEIHVKIERPSATIPAPFYRNMMTADLPPLSAGRHQVKVYDGATPAFPLLSLEIEVQPARLELAYAGPPAPSPEDDIRVRLSLAPCLEPLLVERADFDIRLWARGDCWQPSPGGYELSLGRLAAGRWNIEADLREFAVGQLELLVAPPPADPGNVLAGEFEVEVSWRTALGEEGEGQLVQPPSQDSALFYFFSPANWELMIKVLNGCAINGHYWVFGAASTDVGYTVDIKRRNSTQTFRAENPIGVAAPAITDITAFPCDPAAP